MWNPRICVDVQRKVVNVHSLEALEFNSLIRSYAATAIFFCAELDENNIQLLCVMHLTQLHFVGRFQNDPRNDEQRMSAV